MPPGRQAYRGGTLALSVLMLVVGVAMVASTLAAGGGPLAGGVILGILFAAAGGARLYLLRRT